MRRVEFLIEWGLFGCALLSIGTTIGIIASTFPAMTLSGVRSSWLTSLSSVRRWSSSRSSRSVIVLKPRTSCRTGRMPRSGTDRRIE